MKRNDLRIATIAIALSASVLPGTVAAGGRDELTLDANSDAALIVVKADWWQPAPNMKSAYRVVISGFDPAQEKLLGKPFGGSTVIAAQKKKYVEGYLIERIKPGRWVYQSYSQQDKWALCFNAQSLQFEVKPGEVVYLGEFDAQRHRQQLTEQAILSGKVSVSSSDFADFFDLAEGPRLQPIDETQLAAVRAMLGRSAPKVTAPVRAADYTPARFGTGSTLFAERKCGGYFATSAKKKDKKG